MNPPEDNLVEKEIEVIELDSDKNTASKPVAKETKEELDIDEFIVEQEVNINDLKKFFNEAPIHNKNAKKGEKPITKTVKDKACNACDKIFGSISNLNRHILTHTKSEWKCSNCDYTCRTKETLQRHENEVCPIRGPQNTVKCDICDQTLATQRLLIGHKKELHSGKPKVQCKL